MLISALENFLKGLEMTFSSKIHLFETFHEKILTLRSTKSPAACKKSVVMETSGGDDSKYSV